jgi:hypothetical protein
MHTIFLKKISAKRNISFANCLKSNLHMSITQMYERHTQEINYICRTVDHCGIILIGPRSVLQDRPKMEIVTSQWKVIWWWQPGNKFFTFSTDLYFNREHVNMSMMSMMYNSGCEYNDCILLNRREMSFCMAYDDRHKNIFFWIKTQSLKKFDHRR